MIKILFEEPITYNRDLDAEKTESWIYKNPTNREAEELKMDCDSVRVSIDRNADYFVASSYYYTHSDIEKKIGHRSYVDLVIWFTENVLSVHGRVTDTSNPYKELKLVYKKMVENKLINKYTIFVDDNAYGDDDIIPVLNYDEANILDIFKV